MASCAVFECSLMRLSLALHSHIGEKLPFHGGFSQSSLKLLLSHTEVSVLVNATCISIIEVIKTADDFWAIVLEIS